MGRTGQRVRFGSRASPGRRGPSIEAALLLLLLVSATLWAAYRRLYPSHDTPRWLDHRCGENLREIGHAVRSYAIDHQGRLPPAGPPGRFVAAIQPYLFRDAHAALEVLHCPRDADAGKVTSYRSAPELGDRWAPDGPSTASRVMVEDDAPRHDGYRMGLDNQNHLVRRK